MASNFFQKNDRDIILFLAKRRHTILTATTSVAPINTRRPENNYCKFF